MYNLYEENALTLISMHNLSAYDVECLYRYQQMEYRKCDVEIHADDMLDSGRINEKQMLAIKDNASIIAERYIYKYHDCNIAENDLFESLIMEFIAENNI